MNIEEVKEKITPVLREYGVKRAAVFGSVSRGEAGPESDVDLLVKFGEGPMGLFAFLGMKHQLEERIGKKVDLVSEEGLDKYIRPYVLPELKTIYEA